MHLLGTVRVVGGRCRPGFQAPVDGRRAAVGAPADGRRMAVGAHAEPWLGRRKPGHLPQESEFGR